MLRSVNCVMSCHEPAKVDQPSHVTFNIMMAAMTTPNELHHMTQPCYATMILFFAQTHHARTKTD